MKLGRFKDDAGRQAYEAAYERAMADLPAPSSVRDLPTTFGIVRVCEWTGTDADSTPVLLLPGRSSGIPMWAENLPSLLTTGRTFVAFDALGDAGMSVQTAPLRSFVDQARWVKEAIAAIGVKRIHVVGHSFGGATAAALAVRYPERVASLALLEPAFTLQWAPPSTFLWATVSMLPGPQFSRDFALSRIGGVKVDDVRAHTPVGDMIAAGTKHFKAALPTPRPLSDEALAELTMPVYVAIADHDSLAGGKKAADRVRLIPQGQAEVWPATTHSLPMQVPEALAERLAEFWAAI